MPATVRKDVASYYVLTGEGGIFNDKPAKKGTGFEKILDGTSNTLLLVEAKRDIPWTKPEDIAFDSQKPPELGGFTPGVFGIAIADGSVHTHRRRSTRSCSSRYSRLRGMSRSICNQLRRGR